MYTLFIDLRDVNTRAIIIITCVWNVGFQKEKLHFGAYNELYQMVHLSQQLFSDQFLKKTTVYIIYIKSKIWASKIITELKMSSERAQLEQQNATFGYGNGPS